VVLRIVLGGLYVAMAAGQLASWPAMAGILGAYDAVPPAALLWLAAALIGAELLAGGWLLARPRTATPAPAWVYAAVAAAWMVLGGQAYLRGLVVDNCGCFGSYLTQRLTWFTLAQDGLLLVYAALLLRAAHRGRRTRTAAHADGSQKEMAQT
jgi:hypothetical protein